ncbi:uncharacterized protein [Diadema antillarum]|uniref:uncharacterized protein n=1 Tax=Diadema antillarum TaxID=105358 RepID=UPI003A83A746
MPAGGRKGQKTGRRKLRSEPTERERSGAVSTPAESGTDELSSGTDEEAGPAVHSGARSRGPNLDNTLRNAIEEQIALSLRSSSLVKRIADDVYDVIATKLEERVVEKVYQAVSLDLKKYTDEVGAMKQKIAEMKKETKVLQDEKDNAEQYSRRNCLRIYGIPEGPDERTDELVLDIFNTKLGLAVQPDAIDRSHRISARPKKDADQGRESSTSASNGRQDADRGRESSASTSYASATRRNKPRPVIVKFSRYNVRHDVYRARTRLKNADGPKLWIREDLTARRATLFWELVNSNKSKSCWTQDGNIFALRTRDSKKISIRTKQDFENL